MTAFALWSSGRSRRHSCEKRCMNFCLPFQKVSLTSVLFPLYVAAHTQISILSRPLKLCNMPNQSSSSRLSSHLLNVNTSHTILSVQKHPLLKNEVQLVRKSNTKEWRRTNPSYCPGGHKDYVSGKQVCISFCSCRISICILVL